MTRIGPKEFLACPACGAVSWGHGLLSYTHFGGELRTDGVSEGGPPEVGFPYLTRCAQCQVVFMPAKAERVGRRKGAQALKRPEEEEFLEALETGLFEDRHERLILRLIAWRLGNGAEDAEEHAGPERSSQALENLERLFDLLDAADADHLLLKAEVARHLGRFAECLSLLDDMPRLASKESASKIRELARLESRALGKVPAPWGSDLCLACQACGARSRTRVPGDGSERWPSLWVVACPGCGIATWAAESASGSLLPHPSLSVLALVLIAASGGLCLVARSGGAFMIFCLAACLILLADLGFSAWRRDRLWPMAQLPSAEQLLDCIDGAGWTTPLEERWVRVQAWRQSCQEALDNPTAWTPRAERNEGLLEPLVSEGEEGLLVRAELARRAGRFDEAIDLLADHRDSKWCPRIKRARELAAGGDTSAPPV